MYTRTILTAWIVVAGSVAQLSAAPIILDPSALPSTQGWSYSLSGLHAALIESDAFTPGGSSLTLDTLSEPISTFIGGSALYYKYNGILSDTPTTFEWTARLLTYSELPSPTQNYGLQFSFSDGLLLYTAGVSSNQVTLYNGAGEQSVAVDATAFHTYRIETLGVSPSYNFYIDNVLTASGTGRAIAGPNQVSFGDGAGGANISAEISALQFNQIPEPGSMTLIWLFAGGFIYVRRLFLTV